MQVALTSWCKIYLVLKMVILKCILVLLVPSCVLAGYTSRIEEGYPVGMLTDCPGSNKEARISKRSLKKLSMFLQEEGSFFTANRTLYNYYQMRELAKKMDFTKKTILYMNGYLDSSNLNLITPAMGSVYTELGYNVLLLEYIEFSGHVYPRAARLLRAVGRSAAEMLAALTSQGLDPKRLQLLGISHGGQGISLIAKNYRRITGFNVSRVTALDPSGPCFRRLAPKDRIDASDADLVDIIHTNIDGFGMAAAVGHVDFYVNGGEFQISALEAFPCGNLCSHLRSYLIWVAAMQFPDNFVAVKCESIQDARDRKCFKENMVTNVLGPKTDFGKPGIYYLATKNKYPYYMGQRGLKLANDLSINYMTDLNAVHVLVV